MSFQQNPKKGPEDRMALGISVSTQEAPKETSQRSTRCVLN